MQGSLGTAKHAAQDFVDALRGAPNQVAVVAFGNTAAVAMPPTDVSESSGRKRLKSAISGLRLTDGTNWQAALLADEGLRPDLVLLITDGNPTSYNQGSGVTSGTAPGGLPAQGYDATSLQAALAVADRMRASGTRIVGLGLGSFITAPNIAAVSGPAPNDDYYITDVSRLAHQLYDVASKACAIPIAALPKPERPPFPYGLVLGLVGGALALVIIGGLLLSRQRTGPDRAGRGGSDSGGSGGRRGTSRPPATLPDPSIRLDPLDAPSAHLLADDDPDDEPGAISPDRTARPPAGPGPRKRRVSLDFLDADPPAGARPGTTNPTERKK
jgi:hypothetical protein